MRLESFRGPVILILPSLRGEAGKGQPGFVCWSHCCTLLARGTNFTHKFTHKHTHTHAMTFAFVKFAQVAKLIGTSPQLFADGHFNEGTGVFTLPFSRQLAVSVSRSVFQRKVFVIFLSLRVPTPSSIGRQIFNEAARVSTQSACQEMMRRGLKDLLMGFGRPGQASRSIRGRVAAWWGKNTQPATLLEKKKTALNQAE